MSYKFWDSILNIFWIHHMVSYITQGLFSNKLVSKQKGFGEILMLVSNFIVLIFYVEWIETCPVAWGAFQVAVVIKNLPASAGDIREAGSIPGSGRSPGEGSGNPLQYSCLENPMDRRTWWATVHGAAKSMCGLILCVVRVWQKKKVYYLPTSLDISVSNNSS